MPPEEVVHPAGCLLWVAGHSLDINFEVPFQELVYLPIIIVIISDGKTQTALLTICSQKQYIPPTPPYRRRKREWQEKPEGRKQPEAWFLLEKQLTSYVIGSQRTTLSNTDNEHALWSSDCASHEPTNYTLCHIQQSVSFH